MSWVGVKNWRPASKETGQVEVGCAIVSPVCMVTDDVGDSGEERTWMAGLFMGIGQVSATIGVG